MKTHFALFISILSLPLLSCQNKDTIVVSQDESQTYHHTNYASGEIVAQFMDKVTLDTAESFISGFGLTPKNYFDYENNPSRSLLILVPTGTEQLWVDSLNTYTSIIKKASRLAFVEES